MDIKQIIIYGRSGNEQPIKAVGDYSQATASLRSSTLDTEYVPFTASVGAKKPSEKLLLITELAGYPGKPNCYKFSAWMLKKLSPKEMEEKQRKNPSKKIFPYEKMFYCTGYIFIE